MSLAPRRLAGFERVTPAAYNALLDYVRRTAPVQGAGISVSTGPNGSRISAAGGRGAAPQPGEPYGAFRWTKGTGTTGTGDAAEPTGTISECHYQFGRAVYTIADFTAATYGADWYLVIPHDAPDEAAIESDPGDGTGEDQTVVPLFSVDARGDVAEDYRGMPVIPVYGSATT